MTRKHVYMIGVVLLVAAVAIPMLIRRGVPSTDRYNVLLITLDTTRADHLGCYGDARSSTPAMDAVAAGGLLFERAFANIPLTLPSHATILTGRLPPEHGVRINGLHQLDAGIPTLAEVLAGKGYQSGAFIGAYVLDSRFGLGRGFDVYDADMSRAYPSEGGEALSVCRSGEIVTDAALAWLAADRTDPFFCWVHLYDAHHPYHAHPELSGTQFDGQATYPAQIAFMDRQVERLMAFLRGRDLIRRTLVIIVGDHGEGLGDHDEAAHGYMLYDSTQRVPLLMSAPGVIAANRRVSTVVSLADLYPTVLDLLTGSAPQSSFSRSLHPLLAGGSLPESPCYCETDLPYASFGWSPLRALITPKWKYIRTARRELYDRATDPHEQHNLASTRGDVVSELDGELTRMEQGMATRVATLAPVTSDTRKRLESLGYVAGSARDTSALNLDYARLRDIKDMLPITDMVVQAGELGQQGHGEEVLEICRRMVELCPDSARVRSYLGTALFKAGHSEAAAAEFQTALRLDASLDAVHAGLGEVLEAQDKPAEAMAAWRKALELNPHNDEAHTRLAAALARQGNLEQAGRHFGEAARLRPADDKPQYNLGRVLLQQDRVDEAAVHLGKALELNPSNPEVLCLLGAILIRESRLEEAARRFEEALRVQPDSDDAHNYLAIVAARQGDPAATIRHCNAALRLNPSNSDAHHNLGSALMSQGAFAEAADHFQQVIRLAPNHDRARTSLAIALARQHRLADAREQCAQALKINPSNVEAHNTMGIILSLQGQLEPAIASFRESLRLDPQNIPANKLLNAALAELAHPGQEPASGERNQP